jgi:hypothetical protein
VHHSDKYKKARKIMANNLDVLDVIKNIETIYDSDKTFQVLKDFERVIDEMGLYVYKNWEDGELVEGPNVERHWVSCSFMWPREKMPDPMGARRLTDYDCKVAYEKTNIIEPRQIKTPDDIRPGTKKGKLDRKPVWVVKIRMPKTLIKDIFGGSVELDDNAKDQDVLNQEQAGAAPAAGMAPAAPAAPAPVGGTI